MHTLHARFALVALFERRQETNEGERLLNIEATADITAEKLLADALKEEQLEMACVLQHDWHGVEAHYNRGCALLEQAAALA